MLAYSRNCRMFQSKTITFCQAWIGQEITSSSNSQWFRTGERLSKTNLGLHQDEHQLVRKQNFKVQGVERENPLVIFAWLTIRRMSTAITMCRLRIPHLSWFFKISTYREEYRSALRMPPIQQHLLLKRLHVLQQTNNRLRVAVSK